MYRGRAVDDASVRGFGGGAEESNRDTVTCLDAGGSRQGFRLPSTCPDEEGPIRSFLRRRVKWDASVVPICSLATMGRCSRAYARQDSTSMTITRPPRFLPLFTCVAGRAAAASDGTKSTGTIQKRFVLKEYVAPARYIPPRGSIEDHHRTVSGSRSKEGFRTGTRSRSRLPHQGRGSTAAAQELAFTIARESHYVGRGD